MKLNKKLIEVALPLDAINKASAREKSIRHGHPSTLHLWWARRPLAAARAVIFSQMVDDPIGYTGELLADPKFKKGAEKELKAALADWSAIKDDSDEHKRAKPTLVEVAAQIERERLFSIIEELVKWENSTNETILQRARDEIWKSWRRTCAQNADHPRARELFDRNRLPAFHDPFAGGGALPLEAQRLGMEAYASDLNPVAVLINKAMIELPPKFSGQPPMNPGWQQKPPEEKAMMSWKGAQGLAEDVRYYGQWMKEEAEKRAGFLYPKVKVTPGMVKARPDLETYVGRELTVVAWLWARTVKSPNPAYAEVEVPLVSTFMLCTKAGREAYIEPMIQEQGYEFMVKVGRPSETEAIKAGTKLVRANFRCLMSGVPIGGDYIKAEGKAGRIGARLMAVVAEGDRERIYLSPTGAIEAVARQACPKWKPEGRLVEDGRAFTPTLYGMSNWHDLFTARQLVALTTFTDLLMEVRDRVANDASASDPSAAAYADAVAVYLAFALDKGANYWSSLCAWHTGAEKLISTFGRQVVPMVWDFTEANPFSHSSGNVMLGVDQAAKMLDALGTGFAGHVSLTDAAVQTISEAKVISTDPPYYDNVPYADLADFFYVWLRRSLRLVYPDLFNTLGTPKEEELVAFPYRHGGKVGAEAFFLNGMTQAMHRLAEHSHPVFPVTIYYAFKQSETHGVDGTASTGWETFLDAVIRSGLAITGTWPMKTEYTSQLKTTRSALASSIVIVCRQRGADAKVVTRREFVMALKSEVPGALAHLQHGNIAPVDLAQAAIGPGMAVFTRFAHVLDAEGKPLSVRDALALINETLDEALAEQEGDFDADSRWALAWFEQNGFKDGEYGVAETLSKAKNTSVAGLEQAGILATKKGKVRLLRPEELPEDWDPEMDDRLTVWEMLHHLLRVLKRGESAASAMVKKLGAGAHRARELAYHLYSICERKKRAEEALQYNGLIQSWPEIMRIAQSSAEGSAKPTSIDAPSLPGV
jgi:putative DNA methylase